MAPPLAKQGVKKGQSQPPLRRSARLQQTVSNKNTNTELKHQLSSPTSNTVGKEVKFPQVEERKRKPKRKRSQDEALIPSTASKELPQVEERKRKRKSKKKRSQDEVPIPSTATLQKQPQTSPQGSYIEDTIGANTAVGVGIGRKNINPLEHWRREGTWPKEYFEPESNMNYLLARKRSFRQLEASHTISSPTPSDQKPREIKSASYARPSYEIVLAAKGSFMDQSDEGIQKANNDLCQTLLYLEQTYPQNSLFHDDLFNTTCRKIRNKNEAMIIRDISQLIIPSAQTLATYGATYLNSLIESVNEGWNSAIPFYGPRPQPDYSVGFGRSAFTDDQLQKLKPFIGEVPDSITSFFLSTYYMHFPFLTCEVKCGAAALDIADRQNAHSMTLAVRGVVELFRLVKRKNELHREILAFSISHDYSSVRIYGHYPVINGEKTTFYRHPIHKFDFTALNGKEKWTAYRFVKNVYDIWMPIHFKRICSAIDMLSPEILQQYEQQFKLEESGFSLEEMESSLREATSDISPFQRASKRPRKRGRNMELHQ